MNTKALISSIVSLSILTISYSQGRGTNGNERRIGLGIEYAGATGAIMPNFIISTPGRMIGKSKSAFTMFFNVGFGPESGYYAGNTRSGQIESFIRADMSGDQLMSYDFGGMSSGVAMTLSAIPTFIIPTETETNGNTTKIKKWFYLGVGLKYTNHASTSGHYTVVSRDNKYEYTGITNYEFYSRFSDISPTILIAGSKFGISYSPQSVFDKSKTNHTFGIKYLFQL